jgi:hypothetical protein
LYLGVLRIVIKNNIIIDLRTKILFGRCFSHYLEYCFHILFYYYYYYFSIKHRRTLLPKTLSGHRDPPRNSPPYRDPPPKSSPNIAGQPLPPRPTQKTTTSHPASHPDPSGSQTPPPNTTGGTKTNHYHREITHRKPPRPTASQTPDKTHNKFTKPPQNNPPQVSRSAVQILTRLHCDHRDHRDSTSTTATPPRASENPPRKRKGGERERIPMMVIGAEEINKKKNYYFIK